MSMRISVEQLNGETLVLEVTREMEMREVKQQIKDAQAWEDELIRDTTFVELIFGDRKLGNDETVAEVGLSADSVVTAILSQNVARCSNKRSFGPDIDLETLVIVEIPDSEVEVRQAAFFLCKDVAKVTLPSSVRRIGHRAFAGCSALRHVTIPDSVTHVGNAAFMRCSLLRSVVVPDSVEQLENGAFQGCESLRNVTIPDSVTWIGRDAFSCCSQLTLRAPARLLCPELGKGIKMVADECACGECDYSRFQDGWLCPKHAGSLLQGCEKSVSTVVPIGRISHPQVAGAGTV